MLNGIPEIKCRKIQLLMKELTGIWPMQRTAPVDHSVGKSWKK